MAMDTRSELALKNVHPDLVNVVRHAYATDQNFVVIEGSRSLAAQQVNLAKGASTTMHSRHLLCACMFGAIKGEFACAVDIAPLVNGKIRWDWPLYRPLSDLMKASALALKIPIEWGGDWKTFKDGPHFQLPWKQYPALKG